MRRARYIHRLRHIILTAAVSAAVVVTVGGRRMRALWHSAWLWARDSHLFRQGTGRASTIHFYGARILLLALVPSIFLVRAAEGTDNHARSHLDLAGGGLMSRAQHQIHQWQAWVRSPEAMAKRRASRTAYRHQSASDARATDSRAFPGQIAAPGYRSLGESTAKGANRSASLLHLMGPTEAIVRNPGGHVSVAQSALPIEGRTPEGHMAPVDLTLAKRGNSFLERSALVPVSIPGSSAGAIDFARNHLGLRFGTGAPVNGEQTGGGSVLYPNVERDTDVSVRPAPLGAELSYMLRSPASPESQVLSLNLPSGWSLRAAEDHSGTIQVVSGAGRVVNAILPPIAADAQGQPVRARYKIENASQLVLDVPHRTRNYAYPIMVDPMTVDYQADGAYNWWTSSRDNGKFDGHSASGSGGYSMWKMHANTTYNQGESGVWMLPAPSGAYIYGLHESGVYHHPYKSAEFGGLWKPDLSGPDPAGSWSGDPGSGSGSGHFEPGSLSNSNWNYCVRPACAYGPGQGIATGNYAVFGLQAAQTGTQPSSPAYDYMTDATVYYADDVIPSVTNLSHSGYAPDTWVDDATDSVQATGMVNAGLGMYQLSLSGASAPSVTNNCLSPPAQQYVYSCTASVSGRLPYNTSALPEGKTRVAVTATNAGGNSASSGWNVDIDRSPPTLQLSGDAYDGRNLPQAGGETDYGSNQGDETLHVGAVDGSTTAPRSGVSSVEMTIDGVRVRPEDLASSACSSSGCPASLSHDFTIQTARLTTGDHMVNVIARDQLANSAITTGSSHSTVQTFVLHVDGQSGEPATPDTGDGQSPDQVGPPVGSADGASPLVSVLTVDQEARARAAIAQQSADPFSPLHAVLGTSTYSVSNIGPLTDGADPATGALVTVGASVELKLDTPHAVDALVPSYRPPWPGTTQVVPFTAHLVAPDTRDLQVDVTFGGTLQGDSVASIEPGFDSSETQFDPAPGQGPLPPELPPEG